METLLKFIGITVLWFAVAFYRLFILMKVWSLAVVPQFHVAPITMWQAFALSCTVGVLNVGFTYNAAVKDREKLAFTNTASALVTNATVLTLAWGITKLFF